MIKLKVIILILFLLLLGEGTARAQDAVISDVVVVNNEANLLAFFQINNAFSEDLKKGVQHGIPVTFTFEVILTMNRNNWIDKGIYSGSFDHTMTYDNLKKEYTVVRHNGNRKKLISTDFIRAIKFMGEVNSFVVCPLERLKPDHQYTMKVKATLAKTTLPLNFHYLIPFTEFWDLKTDWASIEFRY